MKGSLSGGEANPLLRMLGTFLRLERARLGLSTKDVADRLGLTDTYYRLAESGRAALNQSLTFRIIGVFESGAISFTRFAIFLVGAHWVGYEMGGMDSTPLAARRATEALASREHDFQVLFERTMGFFDIEEGSSEQKRFLEDIAAPEVGLFLKDDSYGRPAGVDRAFLNMGDLPTLSIDIILNLRQSLTGRSFIHSDEFAARWESEKSREFKYVRGLFRSSDIIINQDNLDKFHYDYLRNDSFLELQMIFLSTDCKKEDLIVRFISYLNLGREKNSLPKVSEKEIKKLNFICLDDSAINPNFDDVNSILRRDLKPQEAYWSFETDIGLVVSFVGANLKDAETIRNLNLQDSEEKVVKFRDIWGRLDV